MRPWIAVEGFDQIAAGIGDTVLEMRGVAIHVSRARIYATMTDRASHFAI